MEQERTPLNEMAINEYIENLRNKGKVGDDTIALIRSDLSYGLTKDEVSEYMAYRRNYSYRQRSVYSQCLRKGMAKEMRQFIFGEKREDEETEQLYKLYEDGLSLEQMRETAKVCENSPNRMKMAANKYQEKIAKVTETMEEKEVEQSPLNEKEVTYARDIVKLLYDAVEPLVSDKEYLARIAEAIAVAEKYDAVRKSETENPKTDTLVVAISQESGTTEYLSDSEKEKLNEEINRLNQAFSDKQAELEKKQMELDGANGAVSRLRNEKDILTDEVKRLKAERTKHLDQIDECNRRIKNLELDVADAEERLRKAKEEKRDMDTERKQTVRYGAESYEEHLRTTGGADVIADSNFHHNAPKPDIPVTGTTDGGNAINAPLGYGIPVYYPVNIVDGGRVIDRTMVEVSQRKTGGLLGLFTKVCCKKKSRADIVRLVAAGKLTPAQLVQIKSAIEKGLTEGQLVELINNNVDPEKMKEIIEIAVLENSMP